MGPNRLGRGAHVGTASFMVDENVRGRIVGTVPAAFRSRRHGDVALHVMLLPLE